MLYFAPAKTASFFSRFSQCKAATHTSQLNKNKLSNTESEDLQVQIQAYLDNVFDVGALMEGAEQKNNTL
ncbi:Formin-like protein 2 [Tyrophagus putrescentiae]|nr:Formin-like protein 2 [Tyrophagus putrescentiae]